MCIRDRCLISEIFQKTTHLLFKMKYEVSIGQTARQHCFRLSFVLKEKIKFAAKAFALLVTILLMTHLHCTHFKQHLINEVKNVLPDVEKVIYFSDGTSSQYKNKKNFVNMCQHKNDFALLAEWNFFATLHGKNSCDGIGGTTKREVIRTSLQRPYNDQILTPQDMYICLLYTSKHISVM